MKQRLVGMGLSQQLYLKGGGSRSKLCLLFTRSITAKQEPVQKVELHSFGDPSKQGVSAAVYAVVTQDSGVAQGLVAARS